MGFLSILATIGKILLGIVIAIVTIIIIIFIVSLIKYKKDEENERLVRESDEGNPFSATLLKNMLEDGKITKEKINVYRERIRVEKIRQYKSTVERADAGDKYAAKELVECFKKNKLTPALVKEIRNEIAREKEEKKKREAEEKRRIEEERKKALSELENLPHPESWMKLVLDVALKFRMAYKTILPDEWFTIFVSPDNEREYYYKDDYIDRGLIKIEITVGNWWQGILYNHKEISESIELFDFDPKENSFMATTEIGRTYNCTYVNPNIMSTINSFIVKYEKAHPEIEFEKKSHCAISK